MPTLSIVLAQNGQVKSLVANPRSNTWQPFDPAIPEQLPELRRYGVNYEPYIQALHHQDSRCQETK